jgi:hypothetical protein
VEEAILNHINQERGGGLDVMVEAGVLEVQSLAEDAKEMTLTAILN